MTSIAVVAHAGKTLGGGLSELRRALADAGIDQPAWFEVPKSKYAPDCVRDAIDGGADLLFVWGGDGMVQRCIDAVGDAPVVVAILPAGTGNLLARNLDIPIDLLQAVDVGLHGARRTIDVGTVNGERFAVMAGTGLDALMIRDAGRTLKDRFGRAAYVWTGARNLRFEPFTAKVDVDGHRWFEGRAGCVLVGNVSKVFGGIEAFDDASPEDGLLELGVVTATGAVQWLRALARTAAGSADRSKFVQTTKAHKIRIRLDRKLPYELDGGDKKPTKKLKIDVQRAAVTICVPEPVENGNSTGSRRGT
jgi:diacylglycerol kinase (ATP)